MKQLQVSGEFLEDEEFKVVGAEDLNDDLEVDSPSTLLSLIRLKKKMREPLLNEYGFAYTFPFIFTPTKKDKV